MHLVSPRSYELKKTEQEYLEWLHQCYSILVEAPTYREARRIITSRIPEKMFKRWTGMQSVRDAEALFGQFEEVDRVVQRGIIRCKLQERIRRLEELSEDMISESDREKMIAKYYHELIDLDQLNKTLEHGERDTAIPKIIFSDDPQALIEEAEHEEL